MHGNDSWYSTISDDSSDKGGCQLTQAQFEELPDALLLRHTYQKGLLADFLVDWSAKHCVFSSMTSSPAADLAAEQKQVRNMQGGKCELWYEEGAQGWIRWGGGGGGGGRGAFLCAPMVTA